jgi:hypothetical protein
MEKYEKELMWVIACCAYIILIVLTFVFCVWGASLLMGWIIPGTGHNFAPLDAFGYFLYFVPIIMAFLCVITSYLATKSLEKY